MNQYGIDYNSASNGVFLPYKKNSYVSTEAMHVGSHKGDYYKYVNNKLQKTIKNVKRRGESVTPNHITTAINDIREELLDGKVKLNNLKK